MTILYGVKTIRFYSDSNSYTKVDVYLLTRHGLWKLYLYFKLTIHKIYHTMIASQMCQNTVLFWHNQNVKSPLSKLKCASFLLPHWRHWNFLTSLTTHCKHFRVQRFWHIVSYTEVLSLTVWFQNPWKQNSFHSWNGREIKTVKASYQKGKSHRLFDTYTAK